MKPKPFHPSPGSFKPRANLILSDSSSSNDFSEENEKNPTYTIPNKTSTFISEDYDESSCDNRCFYLYSDSESSIQNNNNIENPSIQEPSINRTATIGNNNQEFLAQNDESDFLNEDNVNKISQEINNSWHDEQNFGINSSEIKLEAKYHVSKTNPIKQLCQSNNLIKQTYQIMYKKKHCQSNFKRQLQMVYKGDLLYLCEPKVSKTYGKVHIICTASPVDFDSPYFVGLIIRHQIGKRFTLHGKSEQQGQQMPQLAGISFIKVNGITTLRITLPVEGYVHLPSDKEGDLSRIALRGEELPNIKIFSSAVLNKKEDLFLSFGYHSVLQSKDNFIITDELNKPIVKLFRSFSGLFSLEIIPPFTPLIGMALAVAILTSSR